METQEYHNLRAVEDGHWWFRSLHEFIVRSVRKFARGESLRILDAGCGTGGLLNALQAIGEVEGIDYEQVAVAYCTERGLNVRHADVNTVDLGSNTYDAITSVDVLYHRAVEQPDAVIQKFAQALKPGGVLFLHLPAYEMLRSHHDAMVHTERRFTLSQTKKMVKDAGLTIEKASYRMTFLLPAIMLVRSLSACLRMIGMKSGAGHSDSDVQPLPDIVNLPLLLLCRLENRLSTWIPLPCGVSLYVIARNPVH